MFTNEDKILIREILSDQSKYVSTYKIKKKSSRTGRIKFRQIIAPCAEYKILQKKITYFLQSRNILKISDQSYAWVQGRDRIMCASKHIKKRYVLEADITDYFGSIKDYHLEGLFIYNDQLPILLNLLELNLNDFIKFLTIQGEPRFLPQGFATSPILANAVRYPIDTRLKSVADLRNWDFTTYGDNIYMSGESVPKDTIDFIDNVFSLYGFTINKAKSHVMPYYQRQAVLGLVVNEKISIPKTYYNQVISSLFTQNVDASLVGKMNQLRISDNKRNWYYINKLKDKIHERTSWGAGTPL